MSDVDDELESIRQQKREELARTAAGPTEPVSVDGEGHLQDLVGGHDVVLVDFYADWCGPCEMLEPTVETIAEETTALVAKVDIDAHPEIVQQYRVQGVPTLYLFADGEPVDRMVGVQDEGTLRQTVANARE